MQNISSRSSVMRRKQNFEIFESSNDTASLETQGQSVGSGEKVGRKFWSTGKRAHGYRLSPNYFQKFKRMPAPDWAQKMLCIIVPNRRTVSPEFFSWVCTRRLLSRHNCPVRSPMQACAYKGNFYFLAPNQKQRNYRWVEKTFGLLSARAIEFAPRIFCFWRITIKRQRRWEIQMSNSLTRHNNNFARASRFFVHFFAVNCTTTRENAKFHVLWRT